MMADKPGLQDGRARRRSANAAGLWAETAAWVVLMAKGWRTLSRRYGGKGGEIDLIMVRGTTVAFVEVKRRSRIDDAAIAITPAKQRLFSRAAQRWLSRNPWAMAYTLRADAVFVAPWRWPRHLPDAFTLRME